MTILLTAACLALAILALNLWRQRRTDQQATTDALDETEEVRAELRDVRRHYETSANTLRADIARAEDERDAARAHIAAIHRTNALLPLAPCSGEALRVDLGAEARDYIALWASETPERELAAATPIRRARKKAGAKS